MIEVIYEKAKEDYHTGRIVADKRRKSLQNARTLAKDRNAYKIWHIITTPRSTNGRKGSKEVSKEPTNRLRQFGIKTVGLGDVPCLL